MFLLGLLQGDREVREVHHLPLGVMQVGLGRVVAHQLAKDRVVVPRVGRAPVVAPAPQVGKDRRAALQTRNNQRTAPQVQRAAHQYHKDHLATQKNQRVPNQRNQKASNRNSQKSPRGVTYPALHHLADLVRQWEGWEEVLKAGSIMVVVYPSPAVWDSCGCWYR